MCFPFSFYKTACWSGLESPSSWVNIYISQLWWSSDRIYGQVAVCGGILRDSGRVVAYACNLGACTVLGAELWAILHGLKLVWQHGYRRIVISSDSKQAVDLILKGCERSQYPCFNLVKEICAVHANEQQLTR